MFKRFSNKNRIEKGLQLADYLQAKIEVLQPSRALHDLYQAYPVGTSKKENWKKQMSSVDYVIMFKNGFEKPYFNTYCEHFEKGYYICKACKQPLFGSEAKYEAATGQPTFSMPLRKEALIYEVVPQFPTIQTHAHCSCCKGKIGSIHGDGIMDSELRFHCQSGALLFIPEN